MSWRFVCVALLSVAACLTGDEATAVAQETISDTEEANVTDTLEATGAAVATDAADAIGVGDEPSDLDEAIAVSVKSLSGAATNAAPMAVEPMMIRQATPAATLPGQRTPQYKTGILQAERRSVGDEGNISFVISSRRLLDEFGRPLLVRIKPTIDGETLAERRLQRMKALQEFASADPAASDPAASDPAASDQTASDQTSNDPAASDPAASDPEANDQTVGEKVAGDQPTENQDSTDVRLDERDETGPDTKGQTTDADVSPTESYSLSTDPEEIARRYAIATGQSLGDEDSQWLLNHWTTGPALLCLRDYFQTFRAQSRPGFVVLDRNHDGMISSEERQNAAEMLQRCDADRNDIVDVLEIESAAKSIARLDEPTPHDGTFLFLLGELQEVNAIDAIRFPLVQSMDENEDGHVDEDEVRNLADRKPDVLLHVNFDLTENTASELTLVSVSSLFAGGCRESKVTDGIELNHGGFTICVSAVQASAAEQISLGLVEDGYPLLPLLDPNDDGRLTIRERRSLPDRLRSMDTNQDGNLTVDEVAPPLRICIGLGPTVHRELSLVREIKRSGQARVETKAVSPPDWFVRMDRNKDLDLSRGEFPGADEQFEAMDHDEDGLIDAVEANRFDQQSQEEKTL